MQNPVSTREISFQRHPPSFENAASNAHAHFTLRATLAFEGNVVLIFPCAH